MEIVVGISVYTTALPCISLQAGHALLSLLPSPLSCPGEASLPASSALTPDPNPHPPSLTRCHIPHPVHMSFLPLTQRWGRSCGLAADIPGWKCLCKASLAWDECCSNTSGEICSSDAMVPCGHLCKGSPVFLRNTHPGICVKKIWLVLATLRDSSGKWWLSQPGLLMQLQTVTRCETRSWEGHLMTKIIHLKTFQTSQK